MNQIATAGWPRVTDASAWTGAELAADPSWLLELDDGHRAEMEAALRGVQARGLALAEITAERFPLPRFQAMAREIAGQLRSGGRGFVLLRGMPTAGYGEAEMEIMFWGMIAQLGQGVTQDGLGRLVGHVRDSGGKAKVGDRDYGRPRESPLHVDLADAVALLCVRQAPQGAVSALASSMTVYNAIREQHPEWLPRLAEGFPWDRKAEQFPGEAPVTPWRVPVFSHADGQVTCRYNRSWITGGATRTGGRLDAEAEAMFDFIDRVARENRLDLDVQPGDVQIASNYTVFHGKSNFVDHEDPAAKRHLMRVWFDVPDIRRFADERVVRYGIVRHGRMGWLPQELRAGERTVTRPGDALAV